MVDPVADKLFMATAFGVVAFSGKLELYEIAAVLLRDIVATIAFISTFVSQRPRSIPARPGGKAVTVAQVLTLLAFLLDSPLLATNGLGNRCDRDLCHLGLLPRGTASRTESGSLGGG